MNDAAPRKVVEPFCPEPADGVPRPVRDNGVDEAGDHHRVDNVGHKVAALGQRARHQRRGRRGKHEVEEPLGKLVVWNGGMSWEKLSPD